MIVRVQSVECEAFPVGDDTYYVPGVDAYVRFAATPGGGAAMSWSAVYLVAPSVPRTP